MLERVSAMSGGMKLPDVLRLRVVSPKSPQAVALLLTKGFDVTPEQLHAWENDFAGNSIVQRTLATRYAEAKLLDDAERWRAAMP